MEKQCIYYVDRSDSLHYKNKEHVIPAGLGGVKKLPKGYVSDEANELFSPRECIALRDTYLSVERNNNGPGKRGKPQIKHITSPEVHLFELADGKIQSGEKVGTDTIYFPYRLGFIFYGIIHPLTQIKFVIRQDGSIGYPCVLINAEKNVELADLRTAMEKLLSIENPIKDKDYSYINEESSFSNEQYVLIGAFKNRCYISSSMPEKSWKRFITGLKSVKDCKKVHGFTLTSAEYKYSYCLKNALAEEYKFVHVKTAFNTLALFKGTEFVRDKMFDDVRQGILEGANLDRFYQKKAIPIWLAKWVNENVIEIAHMVFLYAHDKIVEAYVGFYSEKPYSAIVLSQNYSGEEFKYYFICDWKQEPNKREHYGQILE